jgi:hypothetical protein
MLPISLRNKPVSEFTRSKLLETQRICDGFRLFVEDAKYRASANASVISLEHHISREFDVRAKITELSGRPTDFLVTIDGNVDESRLKALIDGYRLSGKSYVFRVSGVKYVSRWIDHVEEDMSTEYVSEWIDHIGVYLPRVTVGYTFSYDRSAFFIHVTASQAVYSDVYFSIHVIYRDPTQPPSGLTEADRYVNGHISAGSAGAYIGDNFNKDEWGSLEAYAGEFHLLTREDGAYSYTEK